MFSPPRVSACAAGIGGREDRRDPGRPNPATGPVLANFGLANFGLDKSPFEPLYVFTQTKWSDLLRSNAGARL
jgi:hypothetical protein